MAKKSHPKSKPKRSKSPSKALKKPRPSRPQKAAKPRASARKPPPPSKPVHGKPARQAASSASKPSAGPPPKGGRKGITIVAPKPVKKAKPKPPSLAEQVALIGGRLLGGPGPARRPLIPSGPNAKPVTPLGMQNASAAPGPAPVLKTPFSRKELARFKAILLQKRAELVGDIAEMESEALKGQSGSLSNMPQHLAEQGSEAYDQSLALDLAAADRKLIKEIDEALIRIDNETYGVCELTGKPIKPERLEELPWARYSIEAARELERQSMRH